MLSPPNFSRNALARTIAIIASPTMPAAGTAQTSLRSTTASTASLVARSTDLRGVRSVESGFMAARTITGWPLVTPPSRPPALLLERRKPLSALEQQRRRPRGWRSEEHTSELQSPVQLVCRLLLEKKTNQHSTTR